MKESILMILIVLGIVVITLAAFPNAFVAGIGILVYLIIILVIIHRIYR